MKRFIVYYKLPYDRATYLGEGRGRTEAEALEDFRRAHRRESFTVLKIVPIE